MEEKQPAGIHKIMVSARKEVGLTGVKEVISFDAKEVVLDTTQGLLVLRGDGLNVSRLLVEKGEVDIDGRIDSLVYSERGKNGKRDESVLKRLFG